MSTTTLDLHSPAGLLALQAVPGVGPVTALKTALQSVHRPEVLARFDEQRLSEEYEHAGAQLERYQQSGVNLITFFDAGYPDCYRHLPDPPPVLFVRGRVELLAREALVAVVGTREPTVFGVSAAEH